jgi:hypothetical protein
MDPWRALLICVQIALFQAVTCDDTAYDKAGGDVANLARLGCFACFKPDRFGELVEAAKTHDLGVIKRLGESWVEAKRAP